MYAYSIIEIAYTNGILIGGKFLNEMFFNLAIILVAAANYTPEQIYLNFKESLLNTLPADQPNFIALLERNDIIGKETKRKMDLPDQTRAGHAASVLNEIDTSPSFSDEKFRKLLSVMKEYKNNLETLAQEIEIYLDPGIYA